jgi:ATP-dependent Lhr-like helicase
VLYVCPIRALLNNQQERLRSHARMVGLEVFKWHGDVSDSRKQRFREAPAHVLMTTPGSLEVMMISARTDARAIFEGISAVVIQVDAPASVASFLQRLGRTGRRANTLANCTSFCTCSESLLQSVALLRLTEAGWVEDVQPAAHAMHVLAHQVTALSLQEGGISRHELTPWVEAAYPFSSIRPERLQAHRHHARAPDPLRG